MSQQLLAILGGILTDETFFNALTGSSNRAVPLRRYGIVLTTWEHAALSKMLEPESVTALQNARQAVLGQCPHWPCNSLVVVPAD